MFSINIFTETHSHDDVYVKLISLEDSGSKLMFYYNETDITEDSGSKLMFYYNETDITGGSGSKLMFYYNETDIRGIVRAN